MCLNQKQPTPTTSVQKDQPLPVGDPSATAAAGERETAARRSLSGFSQNLLSTPASRGQGSVARTILLGR